MKVKHFIFALMAMISCFSLSAFAAGIESRQAEETSGYKLVIYNEDGTEGMTIDGTKSASEFNVKSALEDAYTFGNNAFLFGITGTPTYELQLLQDVEIAEMVEIPAGKNVVIDLNGYDITVPETTGKHIYAFNNKGNFVIKDSSNGEGSISARGIYNGYNGNINETVEGAKMTILGGNLIAIDTDGGAAVFNCAELVIDGGKFTGGVCAVNNRLKGDATINGGTYYGNSNSYMIQNNGGQLTINNATVTGGFGAVGNFSGTTVIKDGTFLPTGSADKTCHVVYVAGDATVEIYGGTYKMNYPDNSKPDSGSAVASYYNGSVTINGGSFTSHFDTVSPVELSEGATITGGTYLTHSGAASNHVYIKNYLADGVQLGTDGQVVPVASNAVAKVNGTEYETLTAAFAAVTDDSQTLVVLKDVEENMTGVYLRGNIVTENGKKVTITLTNEDWVYCPYTFVLGENITLNVPNVGLFYYAGGTQINGTVVTNGYYQRYAGTKLTINEPGSMKVTSEMCYIRYTAGDPNAGIYINGDNDATTFGLDVSVAYFYQGMINAKDANIKASVYWQTNDTENEGSANLVLDNSTLTVSVNEQDMKVTGNSTLTLKNGSKVEVARDFIASESAFVDVDNTSSIKDKDGVVAIERYVAKVGTKGYKSFDEALAAAQAGQTITLLADIEASAAVVVDKSITIDGNGHKLTSTASRAINVDTQNGTVTTEIKNLEIVGGNGCQRGINIIDGAYKDTPANVTLDCVKISGVSIYGVQLATSVGSGNTITVKNSEISSWIALNINGDSQTVTVENSKLYGAAYSSADKGNTITVTGKNTTVTMTGGVLSAATSEGLANHHCGHIVEPTSDIVLNNVTTNVANEGDAVICRAVAKIEGKDGSFMTLAEAIAKAQDGDTVKLLADVTLNELVKIEKAITINLNNNKVTTAAKKAFEVYANATIKNGTIEAGNRCVDTRKAVELTLTDVNLIAKNGTYGNPQPLTIGGSENGTKVTMTNVNINTTGYGIITFVETELNATNSTISGYNALYVKGGSDNSVFNFNASTLSGSTVGNDVEGNSFSTIALRANNVTVNADAASTVNAAGNYCYAISFATSYAEDNTATDANVTIAGNINGKKIDTLEGNTLSVKAEYAADFYAANYATSDAGNGLVTIIPAAAKVGDVCYGSFDAAFAAAQAGDTITMLADATLTGKLTVSKAVTIDGNGHSIIANHTVFILETSSDCTFANITLDTNNKAKGVKIASGNVVFDNVTIPNSNKSDAITVNGKLTIKNYFKCESTYQVFDARKGSVNVVEGTVFDFTSRIGNASPATSDLKAALDTEGNPFFCAYSSTTYYTTLTTLTNITLLDNVELSKDFSASDKINLNGHDITVADGKVLKLGGNLTITGEGTVNGEIQIANASYKLTAPAGLNVTTNVVGYGVVYENGVYSLSLPVAKIGETEYSTLQAAVDAVQAGETIVLITDVKLNNTLTIPAGTTAILDLNGKTVSQEKACTENYSMILNQGNLTITGEGKISLNDTGAGDASFSWGSYTLRNEGTLVVDNATIEHLGEQNGNGSVQHMYCALFQYSGSTTINGGTISTPTYRSVRLWKGDMTINSGNFEGQVWVQAVDETSALTINGGTFAPRGVDGSSVFVGNIDDNNVKHYVDFTVNYGEFTTKIGANDATILDDAIKGGKFTEAAMENTKVDLIADGYAALPDLNGYYVVGVKPTATVNSLGATVVPAGEYGVWDGSSYSSTSTEPMPLSFVMQFLSDQDQATAAASPYAEWYGDFVITFEGIENGSFVADGCYLAGHYGTFGWVKVPVDGMTIEEGVRYPVMLGVGLPVDYQYICSEVEDFKCAMFLSPEVLAANPNIEVKLELAVVDNSKGVSDAAEALVKNENVYSVEDYTYEAEDFVSNFIAEVLIDDDEYKNNKTAYTNNVDSIATVGKLTYKRTLASKNWQALFVPFEIELTAEILEKYDFAYFNDVHSEDNNNDGTLDRTWAEVIKITDGTLKANHPYLVRAKSDEAINMELVIENAVLYSTNDPVVITCSSAYVNYRVCGTYEPATRNDMGYGNPYSVCYAVTPDGNWAAMSEKATLTSFRLYVTLENRGGSFVKISDTAMQYIGIRVWGEDGTTLIEEIECDTESLDVIYDLQGRRVLDTEKGIYIVNGKKVLIK